MHKEEIHKFLLLGMGGSSLATEVMSLIFSAFPGFERNINKFAILDSTDPAQVLSAARDFPPSESLYIVSSKSGGTAEVNAMLDYFWKLSDQDGKRFIAITDPGTSLDMLANRRGFRATFHGIPAVGGRYSALSVFGLVPAVLMGIDPNCLLDTAIGMMEQSRAKISIGRNPGFVLGAVLGEAALAGRDKLTVIADTPVVSFGSWLEQLVMESSGKQGRGLIVIEGEPRLALGDYRKDRLFIYLSVSGEHAKEILALKNAGQPVMEFVFTKPDLLGAEFYRWEVATSVACAIVGVNAFDQPDVQDNKERTRSKIIAYSHDNKFDETPPIWKMDKISVFSTIKLKSTDLKTTLSEFFSYAKEGEYIAINAYLPRNLETLVILTKLRNKISERTGCATTLGFGPRFLHSTGQYHKGGPNTGLFLQITADVMEDVEIPGQGMTFGVLERAQALGDYEALSARGRRILRLHLDSPNVALKLINAIEKESQN